MSSFYDDASLVVIPSGYKTSKVYAEKPTDGSGDLAFTRTGDTATRVNSAGLIEKVRTNLFLQSEAFNNAAWANASTIATANATTAPDGTLTADKLALSVGANPLATNSTGTTQSLAVTSGVYTYSIYLKAGERNIARWRDGGVSGNYLVVDLTNGTFTNGEPTRFQNVQVISAGNGWYRVVFTTGTVTNANAYPLRFGDTGQTGDGVSGGFAWGAQFEATDFGATPYIPTTTAAVSVGPVANVPRLDYLGSTCPRLLLEPQRTNLYTFSEQLNQWTASSATVTANYAVSPDGYTNADRVQFSAGGLLYISGTGSAGENTLSVYAKATNGTSAKFRFFGNGNTTFSSDQTATGEWQRFTFTFTYSTATAGLKIATTGADDILFWGFQHEIGSYATSYIPTLAASATRGADACSKTGISSLIGQTEGTIFVDVNITKLVDSEAIGTINSGGYANNTTIARVNSTIQFVRNSATQSGASIVTSSAITTGRHKMAIAYKSGDTAFFLDGVQVSTTQTQTFTNGTLSVLAITGDAIGAIPFSDSYNQALLFKTRLTNAELATLTTL